MSLRNYINNKMLNDLRDYKITRKFFFGIKDPIWWFQEGPMIFGLCYSWARGYSDIYKYYNKDYYILVVPFKNDYGWQVLEKKKSIELARDVHLKYLKNHSYIQEKRDKWKKCRQDLIKVCTQIKNRELNKLSVNDLWKLYEGLISAYIDEFAPALIIEAFEPYVTDVFMKQIPYKDPEVLRQLSILQQPSVQSFMVSQRVDFLRICLEILKNKKLLSYLRKRKININKILKNFSTFRKRIKKHSDDFFWIKNNYKNIYFLDSNYFLKLIIKEIKTKNKEQIKDELKKLQTSSSKLKQKKNAIIKKLKLDNKIVSTYKLLEELGQWQDERKRMTLIAGFYLNLLLKRIAKIKKISLVTVQYLHPLEIKDLLLKNELINKKIIRERRRCSVWIGLKDKEFLLIGEQAKKVKKILFRERNINQKSITGIPVSPGTVIGRARIVLDPQKDRFYKNEILIASMTRPEYLPLMKKAKAIVTNEGGITCHAAIVSREFGIPCIVGTKIATKVLKDGDLVEVRAHRGTVTKL